MTSDSNAITARHAKVPEQPFESGAAENKSQAASRVDVKADPVAAPVSLEVREESVRQGELGQSELETKPDRSGQSHLKYMALVSKSGAAKPAVEGAPSGKTEAARDEPPASSQSASNAQIGGG
jgi:hypothetical protein